MFHKHDYLATSILCDKLLNRNPKDKFAQELYFSSLFLLDDFESGIKNLVNSEIDSSLSSSTIIEFIYGYVAHYLKMNFNGMKTYRNLILKSYDLDTQLHSAKKHEAHFNFLVSELQRKPRNKYKGLFQDVVSVFNAFNSSSDNRVDEKYFLEQLLVYDTGGVQNVR